MRKKGMTLIEVGVLLLLFSVIFVWLAFGPSMVSSTGCGVKTQDISNLKNLVGLYISGQTDKKPTPNSIGHRFWLALFVGDPESTENGVTLDNVYASPSQAGNLMCPQDQDGLKTKEEITQAFQDAIYNDLQGWDQLPDNDNLYTSYAGPKNRRVFTDKTNPIVGCDGSRDGFGFFSDGFTIVNSSQGAEFKLYEELAELFPSEWTGQEEEPNWDSKLLQNVINIE